jgi:hypothetical protein
MIEGADNSWLGRELLLVGNSFGRYAIGMSQQAYQSLLARGNGLASNLPSLLRLSGGEVLNLPGADAKTVASWLKPVVVSPCDGNPEAELMIHELRLPETQFNTPKKIAKSVDRLLEILANGGMTMELAAVPVSEAVDQQVLDKMKQALQPRRKRRP